MNKKTLLLGAALTSLVAVASGCSSADKADSAAAGECYGVNACKAQGDCGGKGHSCAGKNSCKGKGWLKMSQSDCSEKGGKFKVSEM